MRSRVVIEPVGWAVPLADCPPGLFCEDGRDTDTNRLGFKCARAVMDVVSGEFLPVAYWLSGGEPFAMRPDTIVQPCVVREVRDV